MWAKLAAFVIRNATKVLAWVKSALGTIVATRFGKAIAAGASGIVAYCSKFPYDCIHMINKFL